VTFYGLDGPDTSGDQMRFEAVCVGLLLKIEYASGASCVQGIASARSVGVGDTVDVDDRSVCLRLTRDALEVRRDGALVASARRHAGMERARSFPPACVD
jgi:hypothetical protein